MNRTSIRERTIEHEGQRYPFSAKRVTVTTVHGYVEADSQSAAADAWLETAASSKSKKSVR